jgi:LCP family protein required for cell wall assembly
MVENQILRKKIYKGRVRRKIFCHLSAIRWTIGIISLGIALLIGYTFVLPGIKLVKEVFSGSVDIVSLISPKEPQVRQDNDRTNILLLGVGDASHDGVNLTDTIILVSVNTKTNDVALVSIPRDIWIDSLKDKINSAYAFGEEKQKGGGLTLSKATVSEILGVPVHYSIRANFTVFKEAIDLVGGITVNVDNTLDDYHYPIEGKENDPCDGDPDYKCRYEHLRFDKGSIQMGGVLALKYVRSRYAEGDEGTDFARSRRQQKVLIALKNKVLSPQILLDPNKIRELIKIFGDNVDTDIKNEEIDDLAKIATRINKNLDINKIRSFPLDMGDEKTNRDGLLVSPPTWQYGAWVLIPKEGSNDWKNIQSKVHEFLFSPSPSTPPKPS